MPPSTTDRLRIVVPRYGRDVVGGAEALARGLARSLTDGGWEVEVWTTCAHDAATWANATAPGTETEEGVRVRRFPVRRPRHPGRFHQLSRAFFRLPPAMRPESSWVIAQGPYAPALAGALVAAPPAPTLFLPYLYFTTLVGLPRARGPRVLLPAAHDELPLRLRMVGAAVAAAGALLYSTEEERALLEEAHPAARSKPHEVGTVGVEPPRELRPERFRTRAGVAGDYLLYGGRATPGKGLDELLAGLARLRATRPGTSLVLTGEAGSGAAGVPGVIATGRLDDDARWDAIAGAAAVVVPSFHESLSLLALEAWAAGRPALLNGASPVLEGQARRSGAGVTYRGADGFAEAAAALLDDAARAGRLGEAGRRHVAEHYRWELVHERLRRLIAAADAAS